MVWSKLIRGAGIWTCTLLILASGAAAQDRPDKGGPEGRGIYPAADLPHASGQSHRPYRRGNHHASAVSSGTWSAGLLVQRGRIARDDQAE